MKKQVVLIGVLFVLISLFFFNPLLKGNIPFPGDLLIGEYAPYNSYSFFGFSPGGYPNKAQDFDVLRLLYPAKEFSIAMFKNFELPFWNPYVFSGNPHLASFQSGTFYPFNIFFLFLPFNFAWSIYIISQPVLTMFFTFLLIRELGLSKKSSIFGGLVFAFSSYQTVWMEYGNIGHSILWLPFLMWLSLKILNKFSLPTSLAFVFSLTFSILAGYIQTTFYLVIFLIAFILFNVLTKHRDNIFNKLIQFTLLFILAILLSSVQLFPTIELISNSARSSYSLSSFLKLLIPNIHLSTLFAPDFFGNPATRNYWLNGTYIERVSYIGVIPLFFVLYGFLKKLSKETIFFAASTIIVGLITFDSIFSRTLYGFFLPPLISTAVPTRIMFLFCFSGSILAAFGFNSFEKEKAKRYFIVSSLILLSIYVSLWFFTLFFPFIFKDQSLIANLKISQRNLIIPSGLFLLWFFTLFFVLKFEKYKKYVFLGIILLTIFDLFYFFQKITPFSPKESIYPKTEVLEQLKKIQGVDRFWGYGSAYIDANIQSYEKIYSTNGYDALHIKRYGELLTSSKDGRISSVVPGSDAVIQGFGEDDLRNNPFRQKLLNLMAVKYVLNKTSTDKKSFDPDEKTFPKESYKLIWQKGAWQIYENKKTLPRFFLINNYQVFKNKEEFQKIFFSETFDPSKTVLMEEDVNNFVRSNDLNHDIREVQLVLYKPNKIIFSTNTSFDSILFLSDNYCPGWKALIDGSESKIYRANYSFRAVPIKKGRHEVIFSYYPNSFDLGLKISGLAFFSIIIYSAVWYTRMRRRNV